MFMYCNVYSVTSKVLPTLQPIHIMMVVGGNDLKTIKTLLGSSNLNEVSRASCWQILGLQCVFIYDQWMYPGAKVQGWAFVKMWVVFVFYLPMTTHSGATTSLGGILHSGVTAKLNFMGISG